MAEGPPSKDKCENLAVVRRFWPGQEPDVVCLLHAHDSKEVADAMGFSLHLEPIGYSVGGAKLPDFSEFPTCSCNKGFSQRVYVGDDDG